METLNFVKIGEVVLSNFKSEHTSAFERYCCCISKYWSNNSARTIQIHMT